MQIEHKDLNAAAKAGIITTDQVQKLWNFFHAKKENVASFRFIHMLYYLGGLLAISAVTIYVTKAWDKIQGYPLLGIAVFFMAFGIALTHYFLKKNLRIPAGIMATFSLALVPLVVYNIQFLLGFTPSDKYHYSDFHFWVDWYWISMELATIIVGCIMLYFYRFPFLLFPIAIVLWYMSMDLWPFLLHMQHYTFSDRATFTMFFGLFILLIALIVDFKFDDTKEDYAFWLYIVGVLTFWGGMSSHSSNSELSKFFYALINVGMLFVSVILNRRVFAVFGILGILGYLGHLAFTVFANSLGFPIVLVIIGVLIIFAGIFFTRMEKRLRKFMRPYIPKKILKKIKF